MNTETRPAEVGNALLEKAFKKYPKARKIAVQNATGFGTYVNNFETYNNAMMDARLYKWDSPTVNAIKFILNAR